MTSARHAVTAMTSTPPDAYSPSKDYEGILREKARELEQLFNDIKSLEGAIKSPTPAASVVKGDHKGASVRSVSGPSVKRDDARGSSPTEPHYEASVLQMKGSPVGSSSVAMSFGDVSEAKVADSRGTAEELARLQ